MSSHELIFFRTMNKRCDGPFFLPFLPFHLYLFSVPPFLLSPLSTPSNLYPFYSQKLLVLSVNKSLVSFLRYGYFRYTRVVRDPFAAMQIPSLIAGVIVRGFIHAWLSALGIFNKAFQTQIYNIINRTRDQSDYV